MVDFLSLRRRPIHAASGQTDTTKLTNGRRRRCRTSPADAVAGYVVVNCVSNTADKSGKTCGAATSPRSTAWIDVGQHPQDGGLGRVSGSETGLEYQKWSRQRSSSSLASERRGAQFAQESSTERTGSISDGIYELASLTTRLAFQQTVLIYVTVELMVRLSSVCPSVFCSSSVCHDGCIVAKRFEIGP